MNERIKIHFTRIHDQGKSPMTFEIFDGFFHPDVYKGDYKASFDGNTMVLIHRQYPSIVRKFAVTYELTDDRMTYAWMHCHDTVKGMEVLNRIARMRVYNIIRIINKG